MATDKPIALRATARLITDNRPAEIIPIYPNHKPDPYPERIVTNMGVRQHTELGPLPNWTAKPLPPTVRPFPFAASLRRDSNPGPVRRIPWVSMSLYVLGQVILATAIGFGQIGPVPGIAVCVLWLLCGLLLVAAHVVSQSDSGR